MTTEAKAKELRPFAERLITKAKNALTREQSNALPEGQSIDIHNRRIVSIFLNSKAVLQELFETIAPALQERPGGYTRIVKLGARRGDASKMAVIELVDWSQPQDGAVSLRRKKKSTKAKKATKVKATPKETATEDLTTEQEVIQEQTQSQAMEDTPEQKQAQIVEETQEQQSDKQIEEEKPVIEEEVVETTEQLEVTDMEKKTDDENESKNEENTNDSKNG